MAYTPTLLTSSAAYSATPGGSSPNGLNGSNGDHLVQLPSSKALVALVYAGGWKLIVTPSGGSPQTPISITVSSSTESQMYAVMWADTTQDIVYISAVWYNVGETWTSKYSINVSGNTATLIDRLQPTTDSGPFANQSAQEVMVSSSLVVGATTIPHSGSGSSGTVFLTGYAYNPNAGTSTASSLLSAVAANTTTTNIVDSATGTESYQNVSNMLLIGTTPYAFWGMSGNNEMFITQITVNSGSPYTFTGTRKATYTLSTGLSLSSNSNAADACTDGTDIYIAYLSSGTNTIQVAKYTVLTNTTTNLQTITISSGSITNVQIRFFNNQLYIAWNDTQTQASGEACYTIVSTSGSLVTGRTVYAGGDASGYSNARLSVIGTNLYALYEKGTTNGSASIYYGVLDTSGGGSTGTNEILYGTSNSTSQASGSLSIVHSLNGYAKSTSIVNASLTVSHTLDGSAKSQSTASGSLTVSHTIDGKVNGTSNATGQLGASGDSLYGRVSGVSTSTGSLTVGHSLNGQVKSGSSVIGELTVTHPLQATVQSQSTSKGILSTTADKSLYAHAQSVSQAVGMLAVAHALGASVKSSSGVIGDLTHAVPLGTFVVSNSKSVGVLSNVNVSQIISRVELQGRRDLYVQLQGRRDLTINLKGSL